MRKPWVWALAALAVLTAASGLSAAKPELHPMAPAATLEELAGPPPKGAQVVTVGIYPTVVDDLNIASSTYDTVFYIWMKWKGPIDPTAGLEFTNNSERQNFTIHKLL